MYIYKDPFKEPFKGPLRTAKVSMRTSPRPCPGHKVQVRHTQDPHYANLRFCVAGEGGHAPPHTRRKTTVCVANLGSGPKKSISTPTRRQKLSIWESA